MASLVLESPKQSAHGRVYRRSERVFARLVAGYERILKATLHYRRMTMAVNLLLIAVALGEAVRNIQAAEADLGRPATLQTSFQGTAQEFQSSLSTQPLLIAAALFAVCIVLGVLYESFVHPLTILLTLPSASVGALFFLWIFGFDLTMMAIIGLLMPIGIVKKNAIMIDRFCPRSSSLGAQIARRRHL
jgi:multidrug efflux pump subunit AcrB